MCSVAQVVSDSETPWNVAHQAPLSTGFSRQEYWSALPCPTPGDLPDPRIEPVSPASPVLQADSFPPEQLWKPLEADTEYQSSQGTLSK